MLTYQYAEKPAEIPEHVRAEAVRRAVGEQTQAVIWQTRCGFVVTTGGYYAGPPAFAVGRVLPVLQ